MSMHLELYIWTWIHLHPRHVMRRLTFLLGISILILGPLLYLNVSMVRKGFELVKPGLEINLNNATLPQEPSDD